MSGFNDLVERGAQFLAKRNSSNRPEAFRGIVSALVEHLFTDKAAGYLVRRKGSNARHVFFGDIPTFSHGIWSREQFDVTPVYVAHNGGDSAALPTHLATAWREMPTDGKDGPPTDGSLFLFKERSGRVQVGRYRTQWGEPKQIYVCLTGSETGDYYPTFDVTHWMPIPE